MQKYLILIDDHKMILKGLASCFENKKSWSILFTASSKNEVLDKISEYEFEDSDDSVYVAVIDIKVGDDNGYEIYDLLKSKIPELKTIIFTMYSTYGNIVYSFEKGCEGFLSKDADESELFIALDAVASGKTYIQQDLMHDFLLVSNRVALLTAREKQIYDMLCEGKDKKDICSSFKISQRTCENYFSILYSKMDVSDAKELKEKYGLL